MNPDWMQTLVRCLLPDWHTGSSLVPALLVGLHMLRQNRARGKIATWMLCILLFPILGTLSYLLFAGRKLSRTTRLRKIINRIASELGAPGTPPPPQPGMDAAATPPATTDIPTPPETLGGNAITLLADEDGTSTYNALLREIAAARQTIHITTYILGRDIVGREIIAALARRARDGVRVRLLVDALGSFGAKWGLCAPLEQAGGHVRRFMPVLPLPRHWRGSANLRNHRKIAIFDGQRAIIGGQNLAIDYIGPAPRASRYRDFSALVEGPSVAALTRIFLGDWCFAARESPSDHHQLLRHRPAQAGPVRLEIISGGPDSFDDTLWERLLVLIQESRSQITLVTPYLVPDDVLLRVLLLKIRAGVHTRLILPRTSDHPLLDLARRPFLRALHHAGAEILLHDNRMLHAKLFLLDSGTAVIGSANLDTRSLLVNFEVAAIVHSHAAIRPLRLLADDLAAHSTPHAGPGLESRTLRGRALESLASILAPLL
ncbi:MAG: phospholipase D-like domain-containing protein [Puniceicoccales bacterium]|jgi:cardiolipin synthase|nr:phospholipase D-like domain-containing protein [Puniceicoccales bacterium]